MPGLPCPLGRGRWWDVEKLDGKSSLSDTGNSQKRQAIPVHQQRSEHPRGHSVRLALLVSVSPEH